MWTMILAIVGGLFGVQAGGGDGTLGGLFFAFVGLFGGGYLGYKLDKGFEVDAKEKYQRKMQEQKEREDRDFELKRKKREEEENS
jgi:uncharacterized protein YcfJ